MHKFSIITTLFSGILLVIFSCKHQPEDFTTQAGSAGPNAAAVCFESDVLPLFQSYCAKSGCHDAISHQGDYVLDTYENIVRQGIIPGNATNSKMYQVLFENGSDKMPPTPNADLSTTQKSLIGRWINEGARKTTACSIACDTTQFKFGTNISVILNTYCTSCHGGATPSANINLTVWSGVRQVAIPGRLVGAVSHDPGFAPMPNSGGKISDCQITQIKKWVASGSPNN